jgi:hypothetical protein
MIGSTVIAAMPNVRDRRALTGEDKVDRRSPIHQTARGRDTPFLTLACRDTPCPTLACRDTPCPILAMACHGRDASTVRKDAT